MTASSRQYRYNVVAQIPLEQPNETPDTVPDRCPESCGFLAPMALVQWCPVSTLWQRCGRVTRTVRQRSAALQLCTLRYARGPAVCHVHGLDQFDLRKEHVDAPRMVAGDRLVAMAADRHSNCRRR